MEDRHNELNVDGLDETLKIVYLVVTLQSLRRQVVYKLKFVCSL